MAKLHIHVIFEHGSDLKPFGVAYIRDLLPLMHPVNQGRFLVSQSTNYQPADLIILERAWKPNIRLEQAEHLVERIRRDGVGLVYSIDDNLLDLEAMPLEARMAVRYFCRQADGVLVSTEALRQRLASLQRNIFVLPNCLDERLFGVDGRKPPLPAPDPQRKVIGYMGTFTHNSDLMMVIQPLRAVLRRDSAIEFQIVGGISDSALLTAFDGLPVASRPKVLKVPVEDVAYPSFVAWMRRNTRWDMAIAPLEDSYFTRFKSDIKFLDYSALGIAGIYSRVPPYERTVRHMDTGLLVDNEPAAWEEALNRLLNNISLRQSLAANAQEYVFTQRTLQKCAKAWQEAIYSIVSLQAS